MAVLKNSAISSSFNEGISVFITTHELSLHEMVMGPAKYIKLYYIKKIKNITKT